MDDIIFFENASQKITDFIELEWPNFPTQIQAKAIYDFEQNTNIRIENSKVFIKDLLELTKQAAFYRKQNNAN